ncbi:hypothetical protein KR009_010117 [Drosophila setifemur]|nr:hypothetical protein KR009_010117 [Drosophila setifemur]
MEVLRARPGLLLVILVFLGQWPEPRANLWFEQHPFEQQMASQIAKTLMRIFTNSFSAYKISAFISTKYQELSRDRVNLVRRVLDSCVRRPGSLMPVVLGPRLGRKVEPQIFAQVMFVQNVEQVIDIAEGSEKNTLYLIIWLTPLPELRQLSAMSEIFAYFLHQRYNINVLILVPSVQVGIRAYNVRPYTALSCTSTAPVEISLRETGLWDMYPPRLKDLQGCPLSVVVWDIPPYMTVHWNRSDPRQMMDGLDGELLRIVAAKMNFTIRLMRNEPNDLIGGASYVNGTLTGAYQMLRERRANLTIGCAACTPERSTFLGVTGPYSQIAYVIVMRTRGGYSIYEIMMFPFKAYAWLLLGVLVLLRLILRTWWRMPGPLLVGWMLWIFVIRAGYEASIFKFVHNSPVKPLPHTFEQMLGSGFHFITDHATFRMTLKMPNFLGRTSIAPGQPVDMFDALLRESSWKTGAFTSRAFLAHHITKHKDRRNRFVILAEKILDNMLCMYFPQNSYFAWEISRLLFKMRSFGIFQHLSQRLDWNNMPTTSDSMGYRSLPEEGEDVATGFAESMGFILAALNCLLGALGLAIAVFALELLSQRRRWRGLIRLFEWI